MPFSLRSYFRDRFADVIRDRKDMHHFQSEIALPFLKAHKYSSLFAGLGMGKSVTALTLIVDALMVGEWGPWLVIGPKRVVTSTWPSEIREWRHLACLTYASPFDKQYRKEVTKVAKETADFWRDVEATKEPTFDLPYEHNKFRAYVDLRDKRVRKKVAEARWKQSRKSIVGAFKRNPAIVHLVNRETFETLVAAWGTDRWPYKWIIVDEWQSFKGYKTGRFKAMKAIRQEGRVKRLHGMTGTPAAESYLDLFAPIYLLDFGKRLGKNITRFRAAYFDKSYDGWSWDLKDGADKVIAENISDICLTLRAEDYLPMDKPLFIKREVTLSREERRRYDEFEETFVLKLPSGVDITVDNAAALQLKLLQCSSGAVYGENKSVHHLHDAKIEALAEVIEEAQGTPVLVAYWFKPTLARLKKAFPKAAVLDDQGKIIPKWNKRQVPIMFIHPQSGGAGLNLQHGSNILVIFDMFYANEHYTQLVGRLARQGQKEIVRVIHLCATGTFDSKVIDVLDDKENGQKKLLLYIKEIRERMEMRTEL